MNEIVFLVSKSDNGDIRVSTGRLKESSDFFRDKTIEISPKRPNLLWNLLYEMASIPMPILKVVPDPEPKPHVPESPHPDDSLKNELQGMMAKDIIKMVYEKTGTMITISPKSKQNIIKKALKLLK